MEFTRAMAAKFTGQMLQISELLGGGKLYRGQVQEIIFGNDVIWIFFSWLEKNVDGPFGLKDNWVKADFYGYLQDLRSCKVLDLGEVEGEHICLSFAEQRKKFIFFIPKS